MNMGGTETLTIRLLNWYRQNNYRSILLTLDEITSMTLLEDIKKINIEHYVYNHNKREFYSCKSNKLTFNSKDNCLIITHFMPEFFECFSMLTESKYSCKFRHTIYIVHPYSTYMVSKKIAFIGKGLIDYLLKKNVIVFMDETCIEKCVNYYGLIPEEYDLTVLRLPISVNCENIIANRNKIFNILTVSRFEFPFKGYVIGLIKSFEKLYTVNNNISLTIIGYGEGKDSVLRAIRDMQPVVAEKISVIDQVPYSKLNEYILKSDVFVGMGTTILDAAQMSKICIVAIAYQMSDHAAGFLHDNYKNIGEIYDKSNNYPSIYNLLNKALDFNNDEFKYYSDYTYRIIKECYNIDVIAPKLWQNTSYLFTINAYLLVKLLAALNVLITLIAKKFIKREYNANGN